MRRDERASPPRSPTRKRGAEIHLELVMGEGELDVRAWARLLVRTILEAEGIAVPNTDYTTPREAA